MNKPLTFLLALTFLFLFSGSVYGQEEVKKEYWDNGKLRTEFHYKNKSPTVWTWYYKTGVKQSVAQNFMLIDSCFKNDYNASLRPTRKVGKPVKGGTIVGQNKIYLILIPPEYTHKLLYLNLLRP